MALHDVSKNDTNRIKSPRANFTDVQPNNLRMAHGTTQFTYSEDGEQHQIGIRMRNGRMEVVNNLDQVIANLGFRDTDGDGAIDVAKPGDSL